MIEFLYTAISRKVVGQNVHATIPKGNMGYDQYTVPDVCSSRTYFCCFPLALENKFPGPFVPILSNFFKERRTQNHPQCLLGLSRALFPTTFLETAVYVSKTFCNLNHTAQDLVIDLLASESFVIFVLYNYPTIKVELKGKRIFMVYVIKFGVCMPL